MEHREGTCRSKRNQRCGLNLRNNALATHQYAHEQKQPGPVSLVRKGTMKSGMPETRLSREAWFVPGIFLQLASQTSFCGSPMPFLGMRKIQNCCDTKLCCRSSWMTAVPALPEKLRPHTQAREIILNIQITFENLFWAMQNGRTIHSLLPKSLRAFRPYPTLNDLLSSKACAPRPNPGSSVELKKMRVTCFTKSSANF